MVCAGHPGVEAFKQCVGCGKYWCDACPRVLRARSTTIEVCPACSGVLRVAAHRLAAPAEDTRSDLARPFTRDGLLTALALAVPAWLAGVSLAVGTLLTAVVAVLMSVVYLGGIASYYFALVGHVGRGREGLPMPSEMLDDWAAMLGQILRGMLCLLAAAAPLTAWVTAGPGSAGDVLGRPGVALALAAVGLVYLPASVLAVVITGSPLAALWPVAWVRIIARAPVPYARLVVLFLLSGLAWLLAMLAGALLLGRIPLVGGLLKTTVGNLVLLVQASLCGGFLRRHADELGYE